MMLLVRELNYSSTKLICSKQLRKPAKIEELRDNKEEGSQIMTTTSLHPPAHLRVMKKKKIATKTRASNKTSET
jgi:hypothetical protein